MIELLQKRVPADSLPPQAGPRIQQPAGRTLPSKLYPWWKYMYRTVLNGTPAFSDWLWVDQSNSSTFRNDRTYPINIDEIRIGAGAASSTPDLATNFLEDLQVRIHSDYQGEIVASWMPAQALHTQIDQLVEAAMYSGTFRLPAPYFLGYGHAFRIDCLAMIPAVAGQTLEIALHGRDPVSNFPIVLDRHDLVLPVAGTPVSAVFHEMRDNSLRDAWLDHITFGWPSVTVLTPDPFNYIGVKFFPPSGPSWSVDTGAPNPLLSSLTPIQQLLEQVPVEQLTVAPSINYFPVMIHKPVTPYRLLPGQSLNIRGMYPLVPAVAPPGTGIGFGCLVRGTQEPPK